MIQLAEPGALLALLAVPLILALHLLRPRRRTVTVPATWLWREALRERQRGLGLRRLLRNLSLLLLLAVALAAAVALAEPRWLARVAAHGDTVLVLDVSASMQTRDGRVTRFDRARDEARRLVDALPAGDRMLIMTSGRRALLRTGFEADKVALARALDAIAVTDEAGRPRAALNLALSLLRESDRGRVAFVTDGAFDAAGVDPGSPRVAYRTVGGAARNVAITRFDVRPEPGDDDRFQALLTVHNYGDRPITVPASVTLDGRTLLERDLVLAAGARETLVLPFRGRATGRATARIHVDDDLAADDAAFAVMNVPVRRRVLLVTPGNFYLESVLAALPDATVTVLDALDPTALARHVQRNDVVVLDRVPVPALPAGSFLLVDTVPPGLPFRDAGQVPAASVAGQGSSALLRDVDLSGVRVEAARRVRIEGRPPGLQRLFWSADTALALALLDDQRRLVYLGFDLTRSDLGLKTAFPLLVSQSLDWLRPRDDMALATQIPAGTPYRIRAPAAARELIMRMPDGEARILGLEQGALRFEDTTRAGLYRYSVNEVVRHFAVNLTDEAESRVNPPAPPPTRAAAAGPAPVAARTVRPLWPYLAMAALALLVLEWTLWTLRRGDA